MLLWDVQPAPVQELQMAWVRWALANAVLSRWARARLALWLGRLLSQDEQQPPASVVQTTGQHITVGLPSHREMPTRPVPTLPLWHIRYQPRAAPHCCSLWLCPVPIANKCTWAPGDGVLLPRLALACCDPWDRSSHAHAAASLHGEELRLLWSCMVCKPQCPGHGQAVE